MSPACHQQISFSSNQLVPDALGKQCVNHRMWRVNAQAGLQVPQTAVSPLNELVGVFGKVDIWIGGRRWNDV